MTLLILFMMHILQIWMKNKIFNFSQNFYMNQMITKQMMTQGRNYNCIQNNLQINNNNKYYISKEKKSEIHIYKDQ